jgi:hypothetical protein
MVFRHQLARFSRMAQEGPDLRVRFNGLTSAHQYFHGPGALKSMSVSDALDDGGVEAVFLGVRIRFQMVLIFDDAFEPRGKVICTHCHHTFGHLVQEELGAFTFGSDGITDLDAGRGGLPVSLGTDAEQIVLFFFERAFAANRTGLRPPAWG